ncbi:hypothetical protein [Porphyrobacter sp. YT40]|uniref:hypothetical protein n=1 Tax=Porphyrobacter sp. YT40 TaxID=2547601 RepID=UPI001144A496|nr:hypothetical protein [Porphyrobacter sp. YT40]QDH35031.1 hypothetical protein E2E27_12280 [Porphyrobacter sp. YT40]
MTLLPPRFIEDRAIRDAARAVLSEDVDRLRESLSQEGIASRVSLGVTSTISERLRSGAEDVLTEIRTQAGERKGLIALLVGALILWLAREPIFGWLEDRLEETDDNEEDAAEPPAPAPQGDL